MSFSIGRSLSGVALRILSANRKVAAPICRANQALTVSRSWQNQRGFTRSLWYLCSKPETQQIGQKKSLGVTQPCGCCGLHTKGDQVLVEFLKDEIKYERENEKMPGKIPRVQGFEASTDGAEVTFTKKDNGEIIKIVLNVNNSVDDESDLDYAEQTSPDKEPPVPKMVSKPPFTVELSKGSGDRVAFQCSFPSPMSPEEVQDPEEDYVDLIQIEEVSMLKGEEWEDKDYAVNGAILDAELYDMLLNMLEERGITSEFIDQLVEFSTAYEHKRYIEFLERLKDFTSQ